MEGSRGVLAARRGSWDAWQGWRCSEAVVSRWRRARGTADRNRAATLGFGAAAVDGNGAQEGPRAPNKGTPGSWACVPGAVKAEITAGCYSAGKADHANRSA